MVKKTISSYQSKDKDVITISKIGNTTVVEIDCYIPTKKELKALKNAPVDDEDELVVPVAVTKVKKIGKTERINMIKELLKNPDMTREQIKKTLYARDIYLHNPNPASAFAGDWKGANE